MKNYLKMTIFVFSAIFLLISISSVSAYPSYNYGYSDRSDTFSYSEDLDGGDRGFRVNFGSDEPSVAYYPGCDYHDWSYGYSNCKRTVRYNSRYNNYYNDRYYYQDQYEDYDKDKILKEAFKTYQQSSKQQFQLETLRTNLAERRRYGGYGYGYSSHSYSGPRYYSYGW